MMLDLQERGAKNINFVTGTHYTDKIVRACQGVRHNLTIPTVWNTSSYENVTTIRALNEVVDVYLADFKYHSNCLAKEFSGVSNYREIATSANLYSATFNGHIKDKLCFLSSSLFLLLKSLTSRHIVMATFVIAKKHL